MRQDQSSIQASFLKKSSESWPFVVRAVRCAYFFEFGLTIDLTDEAALDALMPWSDAIPTNCHVPKRTT